MDIVFSRIWFGFLLLNPVGEILRSSFKLYNILGQEVATLVDEVKQQGLYSVQWNAGNVASGLYLYRMQAGSFVRTRKLILYK